MAWLVVGCSSFGKTISSFIRGRDSKDPVAEKTAGMTKFSDNENVRAPSSDRQYKRMNRQKIEEDAELRSDAGSLWVMEGQGAYLFSQNRMRIAGDLLNVKIEGSPKSQLQTKVRVIARLLDRLENPSRGLAHQNQQQNQQQNPAATPAPNAQGKQPAAQAGSAPAGADGQTGTEAPVVSAPGPEPKPFDAPFPVQMVPTRVVEQLRDGSYRVRGMQPFMIGKREYKVIVTGVIRPEDFDDDGVDASRLLDPQFDIVSSRKGASM
jgi:flagellar L-ring protein precursor FlgH